MPAVIGALASKGFMLGHTVGFTDVSGGWGEKGLAGFLLQQFGMRLGDCIKENRERRDCLWEVKLNMLFKEVSIFVVYNHL